MLLKVLLVSGLGLAITDDKSLSSVFDVCMEPKLRSSCHKYYEPNPMKPRKPLNVAWDQINEINEASINALEEENHEGDEEIRRLVTRFFGVKPDIPKGSTKESLPERVSSGGIRLHKVNLFYDNVAKLLNGGDFGQSAHFGTKVPLTCDSEFMDVIAPTTMLENSKGQMLHQKDPDDPNKKAILLPGLSLEKWLPMIKKSREDEIKEGWKGMTQVQVDEENARNTKSWWVKTSIPDVSYSPLDQFEYSMRDVIPFRHDSKGKSHICQQGLVALILRTNEYVLEGTPDAKYERFDQVRRARLILCPKIFTGHMFFTGLVKGLAHGPQPENTMLETLSSGVLALYHELFHLQATLLDLHENDGFPDSVTYRARCQRDANDKCKNLSKSKQWWKVKSRFISQDVPVPDYGTNFPTTFSDAGSSKASSSKVSSSKAGFSKTGRISLAYGATAAMYLSLYDMAHRVSNTMMPETVTGK